VKSILIVLATLIAIVGGAIGFAYSGLYNVAATASGPHALDWLLETTRERSVSARAEGIAVPDLSPDARVGAGAAAFREMCAGCHGAPDRKPFVGARDMTPPPPDLTQVVAERKPAELFWVVKHGLRMSGMPAWGPTHSDTELWDLVAFLQRLPGLSAAAYERLAGSGNPHTHHHARNEAQPAGAAEHEHASSDPRD
jgi:mono/diheme cytochrome c family protein